MSSMYFALKHFVKSKKNLLFYYFSIMYVGPLNQENQYAGSWLMRLDSK